jgi:thymidine kinase
MTSTEVSTDGHIEVITGSMFSGKTEELIRRLERAKIAGRTVEVFKPSIDDRYSEKEIGSHAGSTWEARVVEQEEELDKVFSDLDADVIAVDEANFFDDNLVDICQELAGKGERVIVSGIDQTYRGEPFRPLPSLMAAAEYIDKLRAICAECGKPATRNQRLIDGEPAHEDEPTVVVGADEKYEARCRHCHEVRKN